MDDNNCIHGLEEEGCIICMLTESLTHLRKEVDSLDDDLISDDDNSHDGHGCPLDTEIQDTGTPVTDEDGQMQDNNGEFIEWLSSKDMNPETCDLIVDLMTGLLAFLSAQVQAMREPNKERTLRGLFQAGLSTRSPETQRVVSKTIVNMIRTMVLSIDEELDEISKVEEQAAWEDFTPESVIRQAEEIINDDIQS